MNVRFGDLSDTVSTLSWVIFWLIAVICYLVRTLKEQSRLHGEAMEGMTERLLRSRLRVCEESEDLSNTDKKPTEDDLD